MTPARLALRTLVCATTVLFSVGNAAADEAPAAPPPPAAASAAAPVPPAASSPEISPALIGLAPGAEAPPPPKHRKLWIALGVISGVAVVGAIVAVGVTVGTSSSSHESSVFHDWGTLTVTRR